MKAECFFFFWGTWPNPSPLVSLCRMKEWAFLIFAQAKVQTILQLSHYSRVKEWAFIIFDCGIIDQNSPLALRSTLDWCFVEPNPLLEGTLWILVLILLIQLLRSFGLCFWRMEPPWCWQFKSFVTTIPLRDFEATWGLQVLSPQSDLSCFLGMGLLPKVHIWFHFCDSTSGWKDLRNDRPWVLLLFQGYCQGMFSPSV